MHNTTSTWKLSLEGMCTGKSEIFYKFKLMKHSCWFTNVSLGNYSTQRQELNNLAVYMCIFKRALWVDWSGLRAPLLSFASAQSLLPSIYKLLLTEVVVKSEPEIFNPFLLPFLLLTDCACQCFLTSSVGDISMLQRVGWQRGEFDLITLLGKAVPLLLSQSDGLRHLVTLKIIFCSQNWRILSLAEQVKSLTSGSPDPIKTKESVFFAIGHLVPKALAWNSK